MSFDSLLNTLVTVERKSPSRDASGGQVENFTAVPALEEIPALVQPRHGIARAGLGQRLVNVTHAIYVLDASLIVRGDRIHQPSTGKRFVVHGVEDMAGQGRCWRIECQEVT